MKYQPTQLALLISLIGIGVSPCTWARVDDRATDGMQTQMGAALDESAAAILQRSAQTADSVWHPYAGPLDLDLREGGALVLLGARDEWAPGETADATEWPLLRRRSEPVEAAATTPAAPPLAAQAQAQHLPDPPRQIGREHAAETWGVRVLVPVATVKRLAKFFAWSGDPGLERSARLELEPSAPSPRLQGRATVRVNEVTPASTDAATASVRADRLLEDLAAILRDGSESVQAAAPAEIAEFAIQAAGVDAAANVDAAAAAAAFAREATAPRVERREIAVETQSSKVLQSLGAILSDERDEVGAIRLDPDRAIVTTHGGKVLEMLQDVTSAQREPEDGPTKRARKLAAAAAKAQAQAAAAAAAVPPPPGESAELAAAAAAASGPSPFGDQEVAISETSLDRVRGGFSGDGLNISFGIERAVYINGALVTTTTLNVSDLGRITAGRATAALDIGTIALIQNGAGNSVAAGTISSSSIGTVIQNTLDGQKIQNLTVINATANSLGVLRNLNLQSSLRGAVIDSLRR